MRYCICGALDQAGQTALEPDGRGQQRPLQAGVLTVVAKPNHEAAAGPGRRLAWRLGHCLR
jgi:hypothetical protein